MLETVIKIEGLKKQYRLGTIGGGTLSADLQTWWARFRGKDNPNAIIGEDTSRYGERFWALDGINLEVKKGEAIGIIGHNGAGKSTLLKILSRVTAPTEGTIKMKGRISSMLEVGTGFHPELTGRENIYMNGAILGMSRKEVDAKIEEIIDFSECRQFIDTPVKRYSSGMYVKLAFAVAAHLDAEIMVMDEVLAVGDVKFQEKCLGKMGTSARCDNKTILYVSHNMSTIRQLCNRCIVLDHGRIVFDGDVTKAIEMYINSEANEIERYIDLSDTSRPSLDHGRNVRASSFEFLNCEKAKFEEGAKVHAKIRWYGKADLADIKIYAAIKTAGDASVGVAISDAIGDVDNGKDGESEVIFDFSYLAPGRYYFYLNIITANSYGTLMSHDRPNKKIFFEIEADSTTNHFEWKTNQMGSVVFPKIKVVK